MDAHASPRRPFAAEWMMTAPVEAWLVRNGAVCIGREVEVGFGVPDLVAGIGDIRALRNRRRQSRPITKTLQFDLLDYCQTPRTVDDLRRWAPAGYSTLVRQALQPLLDDNLIAELKNGFKSRSHPKDPFVRLVAVELKLENISRGLAQAAAYRSFADASYLAVPADRVRPAAMDRARSAGIGLLAVHLGAVEEVVEPPEKGLRTAGRRRMAAEFTLAASVDSERRAAGVAHPNLTR